MCGPSERRWTLHRKKAFGVRAHTHTHNKNARAMMMVLRALFRATYLHTQLVLSAQRAPRRTNRATASRRCARAPTTTVDAARRPVSSAGCDKTKHFAVKNARGRSGRVPRGLLSSYACAAAWTLPRGWSAGSLDFGGGGECGGACITLAASRAGLCARLRRRRCVLFHARDVQANKLSACAWSTRWPLASWARTASLDAAVERRAFG
jgi:hypothetical protein